MVATVRKPPKLKALPQRREFAGDASLERMQQAREDLSKTLSHCPFLLGRLVSVQFKTGGSYQTVHHGLGVIAACFPIRMNYDAGGAASGPTFAENPDQTGVDLKNEISLVASATVTVDLWFYPRASKALDPRTGVGF